MSAQHDVVIIGGGAIGLWAAYYLKTRSSACRVAVVERDFAWTLASTPRASGGVRRLFALPENIELSNASIPVYQAFADLMEVDGEKPDIGFRKNGYLFIVPPAGVANLLRNFERQRRHGVNVDWLEPADLKKRFPSMRVDDLGAAVQSPDDGWLDPYSVLAALRRKTRALGVELIQDEVVALDRAGSLISAVVLKSGARLRTDSVINAAGAWAPQICAMVSMTVPITPLAALRALFRVPGSRGAAALPQGRRSPGLPAGGQGLFGRRADAQRAARLQLRGRSRLLRRGRVAGAGASLPAVREDEMQGHPARPL